ncbi:MAG: Asp-tRNA(Asn)/Glu-tRNA(Gln) amidotransferase subunit GatC [Betaproteobacteria bacterium]|nr:Asp-tRNA(Asn)/Glu-tRNA(Gln) amidotransferase subunit GatC [Betaproteobacteria bacterium]
MSLDLAQIEHIALLARIALDPAEAQAVQDGLNRVLGLIEEMQAVDTSGIEPMSHALDLEQPLREDRVTETDQRALFQSVAPSVEDGLYLVPKVIE